MPECKPTKTAALKPKKSLRQHQTTARTKVRLGFVPRPQPHRA